MLLFTAYSFLDFEVKNIIIHWIFSFNWFTGLNYVKLHFVCFGKKSPFDSQYICSDICLRTLVNSRNSSISCQGARFKFRGKSAQLFKEGTLLTEGAYHAAFAFYHIMVIQCILYDQLFFIMYVSASQKSQKNPVYIKELCNKPFPSSLEPPFQSEPKCKVPEMKMSFHSYGKQN